MSFSGGREAVVEKPGVHDAAAEKLLHVVATSPPRRHHGNVCS